MTDWWVVQTEAQREHLAISQLGRLGFSIYAPRIKHRSRVAWLFPTYVFVAAAEQFYPVLWCPRVIRLLMSGDRPARLANNIIAAIHARERDGFVNLPAPAKHLKKGQDVRILNGSFCGHVGLFDGASSRERVRVLLDLLGQAVPVELPEKDVAPLHVAPVASMHRMR